ncbi:hypothetical protein KZP23_04825 [Echinicola marina]|uniref:hypothetical protein n=1 Tax=Echinicola marina TaxID=2859768 RepID=UPI001CF61C3F|nr:hypothetical protein [Echinicola marina]UCS94357.1 hypothetical protein KZP23_04825 [Echinicola marina]
MAADIKNTVVTIIGAIAGIDVVLIQRDYTLSGPPLKIQGAAMTYLAMALRGVIKSHNSQQTITKPELTKSGLTVHQLVKLVESKI